MLLNYIDCDIAGYETKQKELNFPCFVAGYLQEVIQMEEFENVVKQIKGRIKHLSFLVHLMCRYEDFDKVYSEYKSVQEDLWKFGLGWEDEQYFRDREEIHLGRNMEVKDDFKLDIVKEDEQQEDHDIMIQDDKKPICIRIEKTEMRSKQDDEEYAESTRRWTYTRLKYKCKECGKQLLGRKPLRKHLFEVHEQKLCEQCGEVSEDFEQFWNHQSNICSGASFMKCEICYREYKNKNSLEKHKEKAHNVKNPDYTPFNRISKRTVCPECGDLVIGLKQHLKTKHSKALQCQYCDKKLVTLTSLNNHIRSFHTNDTVTTCPHCGAIVKRLKNHIKRMQCYLKPEDRTKVQVSCEICGKTMLNMTLKKHMKEVHGELKQCDLCDFKTKYPHNLKLHVKTVHHKKPVNETCPHCNKQCVSLEWHISNYHNL